MKAVTSNMQTHLDGALTTLCSCWKITRQDGHVLGFTDHDQDIDYEGVTYLASSGFFRSAISTTSTTSVDNLQVKGFLDDDTISEADLINGMYDYADVEIFVLNWRDIGAGIVRMRYGKFGEVTRWPSGLFVVELRGLLHLFEQVVGQIFTPECRADLGDQRCTVALFPDIRESARFYKVGERVRIPFLSHLATVSLPIANAGFEEVETAPDMPWVEGDPNFPVLFTNRSVIAADGEFVATAVKSTADLYQTVYRSNVETDPNFPSDSNLDVSAFRISCSVLVPEDGWKLQVYHQTLSQLNDVLSNDMLGEFAYLGDGAVDYETKQLKFANTFAINGSDRFRLRFKWLAKSGAAVTDKNPILLDATVLEYSEDANALMPDDPAHPFTWTALGDNAWWRPSFELGTDPFNNGPMVFGWQSQFAYTRRTSNTELVPYSGNAYAVTDGISLPGFMAQTISLVPTHSPVTPDLIDTGVTKVTVIAPIAAETSSFVGKVALRFFNASNVYMTGHDQESEWIKPDVGGWTPTTLTSKVPAGARAMEIRLWADKTIYTQTGMTPRIAWDGVKATLFEHDAQELDYTAFGGLEFVVVDPGITDWLVPAFTGGIGATLVDGGVTWQAVVPTHAFLCTVTDVTNYTTFKATGCPQPDNWVQFGVITWLTGPNTGRKIECAKFTAPDQFVSILPQPHKPQIGEKFMVHTGCDKGRLTCNSKFANILNFRGEPDIPGTGQYFKVGA